MTEIEFLVKLLSEETMPDELKLKLLARIGEVEKNRVVVNPFDPGLLPYIPYQPVLPYISSPTIAIPMPCIHEYPFPWHSITPPPCKKCGQAGPHYTVTSGGAISVSPHIFGDTSQSNAGAITGLVGSIPHTSLKDN